MGQLPCLFMLQTLGKFSILKKDILHCITFQQHPMLLITPCNSSLPNSPTGNVKNCIQRHFCTGFNTQLFVVAFFASSLQRPTPCEGVDFYTRTERKVGGVSHPCLFWKVQIVVSYLPCELRCYLDWPFPLQVTGCGSAGEHGGGSMIRPDQNCRVWCSLYRCHTHQTVRCPHQVWRSSGT